MKRLKIRNTNDALAYNQLCNNEGNIPLYPVRSQKVDTLEAQVQEKDTLQLIALRYNCSVSELKRLNKIEKDNEIHARSTLRIPITPHTVLLETLPSVHKSGSSSPKHNLEEVKKSIQTEELDEKLIIASVSYSSAANPIQNNSSINDIILNTKIISNQYRDAEEADDKEFIYDQLLSGELDDSIPQPRSIPIRRQKFDLIWNETDCDMSWKCLFICILILCFAIPLIYVFIKIKYQHHSDTDIDKSEDKL